MEDKINYLKRKLYHSNLEIKKVYQDWNDKVKGMPLEFLSNSIKELDENEDKNKSEEFIAIEYWIKTIQEKFEKNLGLKVDKKNYMKEYKTNYKDAFNYNYIGTPFKNIEEEKNIKICSYSWVISITQEINVSLPLAMEIETEPNNVSNLETTVAKLETLLNLKYKEEEEKEWQKIFNCLTEILPFKGYDDKYPILNLRRILDVCFYYHQRAIEQKVDLKEVKNMILALQNISLSLQHFDCFPLTKWKVLDKISTIDYEGNILDENGNIFTENNYLNNYFLVLSPGWSLAKKNIAPPILKLV